MFLGIKSHQLAPPAPKKNLHSNETNADCTLSKYNTCIQSILMHCEWYLLLHNLFGKRTLYHCGNRIESLNSCGFICVRANRKQMYCIYWRDVNKFCGFSFSILKEWKIISFCTTAKFSTPPKKHPSKFTQTCENFYISNKYTHSAKLLFAPSFVLGYSHRLYQWHLFTHYTAFP